MDVIKIENLEIFAYHGVFEDEKKNGQKFYLNAELYCDLKKAGISDQLIDSTHYGEVCLQMKKSMTEESFDLIERACEKTIEDVLLNFPLIQEMCLEVRKPNAPIPMEFSSVSVTISRKWHKAYVAFGSNMGDKEGYIKYAYEWMQSYPYFRNVRISDFYYSTPYGGVEQDNFVNGVMEIETMLEARELLHVLQDIERRAKRERIQHWGPRTLDLDIIFFDDAIIDEKDLQIPHKDMKNRDFVLVPLAQLAGYMRHPIYKITVDEMVQNLKEMHIVK